ncbi:MAG: hypothetical protein SNJ54_12665 [Anaerolineae bacterium]
MRRLALSLLVLAGAVSLALAQGERVLALPDGGTLRYSGDWVITSPGGVFDGDRLKMESDSRQLLVWIYFTSSSTLSRQRATRLLDFVAYDYGLYDAAETQPFDPDAVIVRRVRGVEVAEYTFQHTDPSFPYDITVLYRLTPAGDGLSIEATSYNDIEVGDISSLYDMIVSYEPPGATTAFATADCEVYIPRGIVLRASPSISAAAVRTITSFRGEVLPATLIRLDSRGSGWYQVNAPGEAYVRVIVARPEGRGCDALPQTR